MGMSARMWWNIGNSSLNAGRNMKSALSFMELMEMFFQHPLDSMSHKVCTFSWFLNGGGWSMEKDKKSFTQWQLWDSPLNLARRAYFSKQGRTKMDIFMEKTCFNKLRMQLIFLKQNQMCLRLAFSCLTMPPVIKNKHRMHSLHRRCQRTHMLQYMATSQKWPENVDDSFWSR